MKYFSLSDFERSSTAASLKIDNSLAPEHKQHAEEFVNNILDPLREAYGSGIIISSGYRSKALNTELQRRAQEVENKRAAEQGRAPQKQKKVSDFSAHMTGWAADTKPANGEFDAYKDFVVHWLYDNNILFDQCIVERDGNSQWIHIGYKSLKGAQRREFLTYNGNRQSPKYHKLVISSNTNNINVTAISTVSNTSQVTTLTQPTTTTSTTVNQQNNTIATGSGNTQIGNTEGLLTGTAVYYGENIEDIKVSGKKNRADNIKVNNINGNIIACNEAEIKNDPIYQKDENGDPIYDLNGNPATSDDYILNNGTEGELDEIENINELPTEYISDELSEETLETLQLYAEIQGLSVDNLNIDSISNIANIANIPDIPDTTQAVSQITKTNIPINATYIEQALQGKVLMFNEVLNVFKTILPVINTLKTLCHLLENYQINKERVRSKQRTNLGQALRDTATLVKGLSNIINLKETNFFTIRTQETADWAKSTFKDAIIDNEGYMVIGKINSIVDALALTTGNNTDTVVLNTYCLLHNIKPEIPLNLTLGTKIYYDKWAIENGNYNDGTLNGLDNIEYNPDINELYTSPKSTISSEILRAQKKKIDPYYINSPDIENEVQKDDYKTYLKLLSFKSDEFEGQQILNINDLNLCPPELKNEPLPEKNAVIVEFGDEYTMGSAVKYDLMVKPGQTIKKGDILAYIYKDVKTIKKDENGLPILDASNNKEIEIKTVKKTLKTQFTGVVRESTNEIDQYYYRLYPSATTPTRHFIIDNPKLCPVIDFDINKIIDLQKKFKRTTELEAFIINCMVPSILPVLLLNAKRDNEIFVQQQGSYLTGNTQQPTDIYSKYNSIMKSYDTSINDYMNEIISLDSSDNITANAEHNDSTKKDEKDSIVNISVSHVKQLQNDILSVRKQMIDKSIDTYQSVFNLNDLIGDYTYEDCVGLAYNNNFNFSREIQDVKVEYNNYYINLLKIIPDTVSTAPEIPFEINDDLISEIKNTINLAENTSMGDDASIFNSSFFDINNITKQIDNVGKTVINNRTYYANAIGKFSHETNNTDHDYVKEYKDLIKNIIDKRLSYEHKTKQNMIGQFNEYYYNHIKNINDAYSNLYNRVKDYLNKPDEILKQIEQDNVNTKKDEKKYDVNQQALTLFMYIVNSDITDITAPTNITSEKNIDKANLNIILKFIKEKYIDTEKLVYKNVSYDNIYDLYNIIIKENTTTEVLSAYSIDKIKENALNTIYDLLNKTISKTTIAYLINAEQVVNGNKDTLTKSELAFFNRQLNNYYFEILLKDEAEQIINFWKNVLVAYNSTYNLDKITKELQDYADNMNSIAEWPQSTELKIDNTTYDLYTFTNPYEDPKDIDDNLQYNNSVKEPGDVNLNLEDIIEQKHSNITIMDYEYWLVYMLNATLVSIPFLCDGLCSPIIPPVPLPGIYFPIAPPVMIPVVNVLMVFGIAIRGIWPAPIILLVNTTSNNIDATIFIRMALETGKNIFKDSQSLIENQIPAMVTEMMNNYIKDNEIAQKAADKFRTYSSIIRAIPIEDKALIEKEFEQALLDEMNEQESLNKANDTLFNTQQKMAQTNINTQRKAINGINNIPKKLDRRQKIIREGDLGNGHEPM